MPLCSPCCSCAHWCACLVGWIAVLHACASMMKNFEPRRSDRIWRRTTAKEWRLVGGALERHQARELLLSLRARWEPQCKPWCDVASCALTSNSSLATRALLELSCGGCNDTVCSGLLSAPREIPDSTSSVKAPMGRTGHGQGPSQRNGHKESTWLAPLPPCSSTCNEQRGAGYCDRSVGVCVCMPGWGGPACERRDLPACFTSEQATFAACAGFGGVMSCECVRQCNAHLDPLHTGMMPAARIVCFDVSRLFTRSHADDGFSSLPRATPVDYWRGVSATPLFSIRDIPPWNPAFVPSVLLQIWRGHRDMLASTSTMRWVRKLGDSPRGQGAATHVEPSRGFLPLPNSECPHECHHRGTCAALYPSQPELRILQCLCHAGFRGASCQITEQSSCMNSCSHHGQCVGLQCLCEAEWWGIDCSLSFHNRRRPALTSPASRLRYAPIYVYPMAKEIGLDQTAQGSRGGHRKRGIFFTETMFLEMLHRRQDAVVSDPNHASLFFVPMLLTQRVGNLFEGQHLLLRVVQHIRSAFPFWNRTNGRDHFFFTTQDLGGCWIHPVMRDSIIVSHFGFQHSLSVWMSTARWSAALQGLTSESAYLGHDEVDIFRSSSLYIQSNVPYVERVAELIRRDRQYQLPWEESVGCNISSTSNSCHRWKGACFNPEKDIVVPTDMNPVQKDELDRVQEEQKFSCERHVERKHLIFLSGSVSSEREPWYSQLVRDEFVRHHRADRDVLARFGKWTISDMKDSTFCLCPSGVGYGWRTYLAVAMLCIPVIVQPFVQQAYADMVPYSNFTISFPMSDVKHLASRLRMVPRATICSLRANAARYYKLLMWQQPDGLAYDMLQLSLCRRALQVYRVISKRKGEDHQAPVWSECAHMSADELLQRSLALPSP